MFWGNHPEIGLVAQGSANELPHIRSLQLNAAVVDFNTCHSPLHRVSLSAAWLLGQPLLPQWKARKKSHHTPIFPKSQCGNSVGLAPATLHPMENFQLLPGQLRRPSVTAGACDLPSSARRWGGCIASWDGGNDGAPQHSSHWAVCPVRRGWGLR